MTIHDKTITTYMYLHVKFWAKGYRETHSTKEYVVENTCMLYVPFHKHRKFLNTFKAVYRIDFRKEKRILIACIDNKNQQRSMEYQQH